jgi:hypothetical protein
MRFENRWNETLVKILQTSNNESDLDYSLLTQIELGLTALRLIGETDPRGVWVLISGYSDFHNSYSLTQKSIIDHLKLILSGFASQKKWMDGLAEYQAIMADHFVLCMYSIEQNLQSFRQTDSRCLNQSEREKIYRDTLTQPIAFKTRYCEPAKSGSYTINDRPVIIPPLDYSQFSSRQPSGTLIFPPNVQKKRTPFVISIVELNQMAQEMDLLNADAHYTERLRKIILKDGSRLSENVSELKISDISHLVGVVNSGKSTLIDIIAYYCAKHGIRIGIVLEDGAKILEKASQLEKVKVKAVPIFGKSNRQRHRNLLQSAEITQNQSQDCFPIRITLAEKYLSPICFLNAFNTTYPFDEGMEPCFRLRNSTDTKDSVEYHCPFFHGCPKYVAERELLQSDSFVWLFTLHSLVYSKLSPIFDSLERTYLEFIQWALDLLIIDEVDISQVRLDNIFASEHTLTGFEDPFSLDKIIRIVQEKDVTTKRRHLIGKPFRWRQYLNDASRLIDISTCIINQNPESTIVKRIKRNYINPVLYYYDLKKRIVKSLSPSENELIDENRVEILDYMKKFVENPEQSSVKVQQIKMFLSEITEYLDYSISKAIAKCRAGDIKNLLTNLSDGYKIEVIFFFFLAKLDYALAQVFNSWDPANSDELNLDVDLAQYFLQINPLYHILLSHSALGRYFGYRLHADLGERGGTLKIISLVNLGRGFLHRINKFLEGIFGQKGPSCLFMSATSWFPTSPQYHLNFTPDYVIEPKPEFLTAIKDSKAYLHLFSGNKGLIRVSGISNEEEKITNLQFITRQLVQKSRALNPPKAPIEQICDGLPEDRQKCLWIVGSYDQVTSVEEEIRRTNPELYNKALFLSRNINEDIDNNNRINRTSIEQVGKNSAISLLVVPYQTIARGFNILNEFDKAAFGSIHFLVRPMPHPDDFMINIYKLNGWTMEYLTDLTKSFSCLHELGLDIRQKGNKFWNNLFKTQGGYVRLKDEEREMLLADTFVFFIQTIGRTIRGNVPTKVYFHDAAFNPENSTSGIQSMLLGIDELGQKLMALPETGSLFRLLYEPFFQLFSKISNIL